MEKKNGASCPNLLTFKSSYRSSRTVLEAMGTKVCSYDKEEVRDPNIIN